LIEEGQVENNGAENKEKPTDGHRGHLTDKRKRASVLTETLFVCLVCCKRSATNGEASPHFQVSTFRPYHHRGVGLEPPLFPPRAPQ
jgi:hypothetical protein